MLAAHGCRPLVAALKEQRLKRVILKNLGIGGLMVVAWPATAGLLYSELDLMTSAEPVPVLDMVNGWDGPFQSGRYAYADARVRMGSRWGSSDRWMLEWERRWHYDLSFSAGMSRYYYATEQGESLAADESLRLDARTLEAQGVRLGHRFDGRDWQLQPALALYRVSQWQFGSLNGLADGAAEGTASARLDYHYDQDRILEYGVDPGVGWGLSLDVSGRWQLADDWQLDLAALDLLNRWYFADSGYTSACVNFNSPAQTVCSSSATASGKSGQEVFVASLRPTLSGELAYIPLSMSLQVYHHGEFSRVGLEKRWQPLTAGPQLGVSAYSTAQIGVGVYAGHWHLAIASDDLRTGFARDLQAEAGVEWRW